MQKPFSLKPLMELALHHKEAATRELGQRNKTEHAAQERLDMLKSYRNEYQTRLQAATRNGIEPAELRNFQQFIDKLDDAILQQRKVLEQSHVSVQQGRSEFDSTQRRLKSYTTLQDRHLEEQKKVEAKSEQSALDEHTGRHAAYRMQQNEEKNNHH